MSRPCPPWGDFALDSQGADQQVYTADPMAGSTLDVLQLSPGHAEGYRRIAVMTSLEANSLS